MSTHSSLIFSPATSLRPDQTEEVLAAVRELNYGPQTWTHNSVETPITLVSMMERDITEANLGSQPEDIRIGSNSLFHSASSLTTRTFLVVRNVEELTRGLHVHPSASTSVILVYASNRGCLRNRTRLAYPPNFHRRLCIEPPPAIPVADEEASWTTNFFAFVARTCKKALACLRHYFRRTSLDLPFPVSGRTRPRESTRPVHVLTVLVTAVAHHVYALALLYAPSRYAARSRRFLCLDSRETSSFTSDVSPRSVSRRSSDSNIRVGHPIDGAVDSDRMNPPQENPAACPDPPLDCVGRIWDQFLMILFGEWKMIQYMAALLIPAILTIFQIPDAGSDPVTRVPCLLSLICSVISLVHSCTFVTHMHNLQNSKIAKLWEREVRSSATCPWWNISIFLALPSVWVSWSAISLLVSFLCILWRASAGAAVDAPDGNVHSSFTSQHAATALTSVVALGLLSFYLVTKTFARFEVDVP